MSKKNMRNHFARNDQTNAEYDTEGDFYPTYWSITRRLLENIEFDKNSVFLEPCAGAGDISKIIRENYPDAEILQYDITPRAENVIKCDFLKIEKKWFVLGIDHVITNPPFKLSTEFFCKCAELNPRTISFLWPLDYLHGSARYDKCYCNDNYGCKYVFQFVMRPAFFKNSNPEGPYSIGIKSFAWFHFVRDYTGEIIVKLIDNRQDTGKPWNKKQLRMF